MRKGFLKCADKVTYNSRVEAYDFLSKCRFGGSIYECSICGKWHISHYLNQRKGKNAYHNQQRQGWKIDRLEINSPKICEDRKK